MKRMKSAVRSTSTDKPSINLKLQKETLNSSRTLKTSKPNSLLKVLSPSSCRNVRWLCSVLPRSSCLCPMIKLVTSLLRRELIELKRRRSLCLLSNLYQLISSFLLLITLYMYTVTYLHYIMS